MPDPDGYTTIWGAQLRAPSRRMPSASIIPECQLVASVAPKDCPSHWRTNIKRARRMRTYKVSLDDPHLLLVPALDTRALPEVSLPAGRHRVAESCAGKGQGRARACKRLCPSVSPSRRDVDRPKWSSSNSVPPVGVFVQRPDGTATAAHLHIQLLLLGTKVRFECGASHLQGMRLQQMAKRKLKVEKIIIIGKLAF